MKKILFILLAASMLLALTACGGSSSDQAFEEITVADNDQVRITITAVKQDDEGLYLEATLENKSDETAYFFTNSKFPTSSSEEMTSSVLVNGQADSYIMDCETNVNAGKSEDAEIAIWGDEECLSSIGLSSLDEITSIDLPFYVYTSEGNGVVSEDYAEPDFTFEANITF